MERYLAQIDVMDSIMQRGTHQVGVIRGWSPSSLQAITNLNTDISNPRTAYHYPGARLELISAGEGIAREQDMANNQIASGQLERLLVEGMQTREAFNETLTWQLSERAGAVAAGAAFTGGWADTMRRGIER
jgi:hypothetical protein